MVSDRELSPAVFLLIRLLTHLALLLGAAQSPQVLPSDSSDLEHLAVSFYLKSPSPSGRCRLCHCSRSHKGVENSGSCGVRQHGGRARPLPCAPRETNRPPLHAGESSAHRGRGSVRLLHGERPGQQGAPALEGLSSPLRGSEAVAPSPTLLHLPVPGWRSRPPRNSPAPPQTSPRSTRRPPAQALARIIKPPVRDPRGFLQQHTQRNLEQLTRTLGKGTDETTHGVHLVLRGLLRKQHHLPGHGKGPGTAHVHKDGNTRGLATADRSDLFCPSPVPLLGRDL